MIILGIETSCDETAAAVISAKNGAVSVLSNIVSSQVKLHSKWGGVVPNLAAREHLKNILPVIEEALKAADVKLRDIDFLAVTAGPGLIPALLIGVNSAKTLSYAGKIPAISIHHIEGHIYANFIRKKQKSKIEFPLLCLVVSGGHTELVLMKSHLKYKIIGETVDDAAGEAFDKVARILGLGYPGGPAIAKRAMEFPISNYKFPNKLKIRKSKFEIFLPRPMINSNNFNFSFSGLKTAVLYETKKHPQLAKNQKYITAVCQEFQQAVIDVLICKTLAAAKKYKPKTICLAGGVSANNELRKQLEVEIKRNLPNTKYQIPDTKYSIDNAAMIATAAYFRYQKEKNKKESPFSWKKIQADANLILS
ncbi:MAG TPA: tRNA (adenosine(37)-N6)-threonylcarbamoyltransferase complex transferase subunit TsaD [Patescibacteria group bacterium]|nr:tRNA (adenosine(37)-N6)-threonylcarbamoyltransferase complex transferase subunit TsaD [Patescibacteria group bacterium]